LEIGKKAEARTLVSESNTAKAVKSGNLDVFSTPMMVALMEEAACNCLGLESGQSTVGTYIAVEHLAASALGAEITATATLIAVERRKLSFELVAYEGDKEIGKGTHTRFVIDAEKFMSKVSK